MADFHTLSVLERRHIIESVQEALREMDEVEENAPMTFHSREDLQEILRILGADDVEE